jgi:hypothetical protein
LVTTGADPAITGEPPEERARAPVEPDGTARHSRPTSGRSRSCGRQAGWYRGLRLVLAPERAAPERGERPPCRTRRMPSPG